MKTISRLMLVCILIATSQMAMAQKRFKKLKYFQLKTEYINDFQKIEISTFSMDKNGRVSPSEGYNMFMDVETMNVLIKSAEAWKGILSNNSPFGQGGLNNRDPENPKRGGGKVGDGKCKGKHVPGCGHNEGEATEEVEGMGGVYHTCWGCETEGEKCTVSQSKSDKGTSYDCTGCVCDGATDIPSKLMDHCLTSNNQKISPDDF